MNFAGGSATGLGINDAARDVEALTFGPYRLQPVQRRLWRDGEEVQLGGRAFDILVALVENSGTIVTQRDLIERAWPGVFVEEANLRVHVASLRKSLRDGENGEHYIETVPRRGYSFVASVAREPAEQKPAPVATENTNSPSVGNFSTNLPPALGRMVGRQKVVAELRELLDEKRFVSVVGAGGLGKTTVALAVANDLRPSFTDAVAFIDLGSLATGELVDVAIASAFGLGARSGNTMSELIGFLRDRKVLLVIDNCEHLIDAVSDITERLFAQAPQLFIIATSREALRVEGENVYLLASLDYPPPDPGLTAEEAMGWPAIQLFMERAAAGGYRSILKDQEAHIVAAICSRLDGIALAIELAAGRVASHGILGTSDLLNHRFKLLWQGRRSAIPRHQTMNAVLDWSFNLLPDQDRLVFARLSVLVGTFSLAAAQQVAVTEEVSQSQVANALASLASKSLLWTTSDTGEVRYRLLDMARAYAATKLDERGEQPEIAYRHMKFVLQSLPRNGGLSKEDIVEGGLFDIVGNLRAALDWTFTDGSWKDESAELVASSVSVFLKRSLLRECGWWCERTLAVLDDAQRQTAVGLSILEGRAVADMFTKGNQADIRAAIDHALELATRLGSHEHEMRLLSGLHMFMSRSGEFGSLPDVSQRALEVAKKIGRDDALAMAEWMLGTSSHLAGDQRAAQDHCEAALRLSAVGGFVDLDAFGYDHRIRGLIVLVRVLWLRGFADQATRMSHDIITEADARGQPVARCIALIYTATVSIWCGDYDTALGRIERLIACASMYSLEPYRAVGEAMQGEIAAKGQDLAGGIAALRSSLAILDADRHRVLSTGFLRALAEALAENQQQVEALAVLDRAFSEARQKNELFQMPDLLRAQGQILLQGPAPDVVKAESLLRQAIAESRSQGIRGWELASATALARLLAQLGREPEAATVLREAINAFEEGFGQPNMRDARQMLEKLTAAIDADP